MGNNTENDLYSIRIIDSYKAFMSIIIPNFINFALLK